MNEIYDKVCRLIHPDQPDIWQGFEPLPAAHHNAWGSRDPIFGKLIYELKPELIIEVGSFLGGSAINMAALMEAGSISNRAIICVDTWLAEEVLWSRPEERKLLRFKHGSPTYYDQFLSNVHDAGMCDTICPLRMPSRSAARYLGILSIRAPLIYIDGCHIEGCVYRDLEAYWDLLLTGGAMLIDDYDYGAGGMFIGVIRDTLRFSRERKLKLEIVDKKALLRKP